MSLKNIFLFLCFQSFAQEIPNFTALDSLYREDQFYIGITYNALQDMPIGVSQKKFTPSFSAGFLRDMPINKSRTVAFAAGFGYSINNYNENLLITTTDGKANYSVINGTNYEKNKLILHYVDLPIEFRWRTSTPESHKFYRIYGGFKISYLVYDYSKFIGEPQDFIVSNNTDLSKIQYGTYVDFGYNGLNFYVYYGLNSIYKTGIIDNKNIDLKTVNFGLMFYIL